jgi:hypothetical protein
MHQSAFYFFPWGNYELGDLSGASEVYVSIVFGLESEEGGMCQS